MAHIDFQIDPVTGVMLQQPLNADGDQFPLVLVPNFSVRSERVGRGADTCTELLALLIEGYAELDFDDALMARYSMARAYAAAAQASYLVQAEARGDFGLLDQSHLEAVYADKDVPYTGSAVWDAAVPLVLIDVDYEPFSDREAPTGRVVWIRCAEERSLLLSLQEIGMLHFLQRVAG